MILPPEPADRPWLDPTLDRATRLATLIAAMTLPEKVAQLGSAWVGFSLAGDPAGGGGASGDAASHQVSPFQDAFEEVAWKDAYPLGLGHLTRPYGTRPLSVAEGLTSLVEMQRDLMTETRLGIPAIAHEECLTGFTTYGATIYPTPLALAASFDEDLVERVANRIGSDLRAVGVHQALAPVLDVVRDYRWGRVEETMGEDPYLTATIGTAYVRGLETAGIVSTLKHFIGYSASRAGRNHAPVSMGSRELRDVMLPPFEMAIREGGARSVMNSYTDVDGIPVAADPQMLTDLLRRGLGFEGTVVSDYWAVSFLSEIHNVANGTAGAGARALTAGIDVELPSTRCFGPGLVRLVEQGDVEEGLVDRALARVLSQKLDQGLLDRDFDPAKDVEPFRDLDAAGNRATARWAAEESVILLANKGTLPLVRSSQRIAVIGPCADDALSFLGCYSYPNHVLTKYPSMGLGVEVPTVRDALTGEFPEATIEYAQGCTISGPDDAGIAEAVAVARRCDVVVVVVGDRAGLFGVGTSGEGCDAPDLQLPGRQADLLDALLDAAPRTIVVSVSGRPYALGAFADRAAAMIQAFMPGEEAGSAIAGVISGRVMPTAKLPVQIPVDRFGQPATYLQPTYGQPGLNVSTVEARVLFPFGHGISYTEYEYGELCISADPVPSDGSFTASATITNTGLRAGDEIVQLYFSDPVAEAARPLLNLVGYARVPLAAGESAIVEFILHTDRFAYHGISGDRIVDAGILELKLGASSGDIRSRRSVTIEGLTRRVGFDRQLRTAVRVRATGASSSSGDS